MSDDITLEAWIRLLERVPVSIRKPMRAVIGQGLNNIKRDWKIKWTGYAHIPHLPHAITYDVDEAATTSFSGVVGPASPREQWELGSIIEFGVISARAGRQNAPLPGMIPASELEAPRFENAVGDVGVDLLAGKSKT